MTLPASDAATVSDNSIRRAQSWRRDLHNTEDESIVFGARWPTPSRSPSCPRPPVLRAAAACRGLWTSTTRWRSRRRRCRSVLPASAGFVSLLLSSCYQSLEILGRVDVVRVGKIELNLLDEGCICVDEFPRGLIAVEIDEVGKHRTCEDHRMTFASLVRTKRNASFVFAPFVS